MFDEILALNPNKSVSGLIPIKGLKMSAQICAPILANCFNQSVVNLKEFPDALKLADIIPVHKKDSATDKANYRPISLLPTVSKLFERNKLPLLLNNCYLNVCAIIEKDIALNMLY